MKTNKMVTWTVVGGFTLASGLLILSALDDQIGMTPEERAYHEAVDEMNDLLNEMPTMDVEDYETDVMDEVPEGWTLEQYQAVIDAEEWLDCMAFSKDQLYERLLNDGFTEEDATFAVETIEVDWYEQAVIDAEEWLDCMAFSKGRLYERLLNDGFTEDQSQYAVDELFGTDEPVESVEPTEDQTVEPTPSAPENESQDVTEAPESVQQAPGVEENVDDQWVDESGDQIFEDDYSEYESEEDAFNAWAEDYAEYEELYE